MDEAIQELLDKQSIYEVLVTYCRGADRCDQALIASVYHDDSYDDHGYWKGNGKDFAPFLANRLTTANSATTHSISNALITVRGDDAWSESQVMATLVRRGPAPLTVDVMGARYLDQLSRRSGVWRLSRRVVVLDWVKTETWPQARPPIPIDGFTRGGRHPEDPVYRMGAA